MIYLLFAGTFWQAARQSRFALLELGWMCCYGLLLEWLTIKVLHAYQYNQFLIMVDNIPLCIGLGWAIIIDSSMRFTDGLHMPNALRPIAASLMGLSIDLALDVIAIRAGLWRWTGVRFDQQWFGVPWANFGAWFMVIWTYSGFVHALRSWQGKMVREWFYPLLAILLSLSILIAASALYPAMSASISSAATPAILVMGSLGLVIWSRPTVRQGHLESPLVLLLPIAFHLFAVLIGIRFGVFARQPLLAAIEFVLAVAAVGIHGLVFWAGRWQQWQAARGDVPI